MAIDKTRVLAARIFSAEEIDGFHGSATAMGHPGLLYTFNRVLESHERMRAELEGLQMLYEEASSGGSRPR